MYSIGSARKLAESNINIRSMLIKESPLRKKFGRNTVPTRTMHSMDAWNVESDYQRGIATSKSAWADKKFKGFGNRNIFSKKTVALRGSKTIIQKYRKTGKIEKGEEHLSNIENKLSLMKVITL